MTLTCLLISADLRTGDLVSIADKSVRRTFRLMIPITAIALLEYFLINTGSVKWLEYLPSITWPNWTFTSKFTDFEKYLTEILELAYLIPNAVPRITNNFCTGVLWKILVQLQGSWVALLAVVVNREIRTLWKRLGFYIFCITNLGMLYLGDRASTLPSCSSTWM